MGDLLAIVTFDILPNGQAQHVKAIRTSKAWRAKVTVPKKDFAQIEKSLIQAI